MKSEVAQALDLELAKMGEALPRFGCFIPPMKPLYTRIEDVLPEHGGRTFCDVKYDGYRTQIHRSPGNLKIFSSSGAELNYACYPDLVQIALAMPTGIFEAEMIGPGDFHLEQFENTHARFRRSGISDDAVQKYIASGIIENLPMTFRVFDTLRWGRKGLLHVPLEQRRRYTEKIDRPGAEPSETELITDADALEALIDSTIEDRGGEGRVCKDPSSIYRPGSNTTTDWVKFKRSEELDLVVVGFYKSDKYGEDLPYTSVLVASYNHEDDVYETVGRVGVSRDAIAVDINNIIGASIIPAMPPNVRFSEKLQQQGYADKLPMSFINPEDSVVLQIKAMNLLYAKNWQTCGSGPDGKAYSMRIAWTELIRHDKNPRQATTTAAIKLLYDLQQGGGRR